MNMKEIKELISLMNENGLLELEVEDGDQKVRLRKLYEGMREKVVAIPSASILAPSMVPSSAASAAAPTAAPAPAANEKRIKAAMVGTFYRAPSPESPPYVEAGTRVTKDTVLCLLEAMKVMNEIKAGCDGVVREILVENGKAVEYGQDMFVIALDQ